MVKEENKENKLQWSIFGTSYKLINFDVSICQKRVYLTSYVYIIIKN